jgi:hypothetical protein
MDTSKLVRDASKVHEALFEMPDGSVKAVKECKIHIPYRFSEKDLAYVGNDTYILGLYAIITEDQYYGVSLVNAMINIDPASTEKIKIDKEDYFEFTFPVGSTVFKSTELVKTDTIAYRIYDEILSKGNIPWYMGYEELGKIFDTASYHAGANIGQNKEVTQLIASIVARDPDDRTKYYRSTVKSLGELRSRPPTFIPLRSVEYASTNTTNKLGGSYFSVGVVSALINPTERVERVEDILRQ